MNSILNHDRQQNSSSNHPSDSRGDAKSPGLGFQFNNNNQQNSKPKNFMQQLYKNQLDAFVQQKQKQKKYEKQQLERQKEQYRQRVKLGQQNQKMKDIAYKNYYKLLMQSQDHNKESYVSPYQKRDKAKQSHIQHNIQQQHKRSQNFQYEKRMRQIERKNQYREQLMRQMQQRKQLQQQRKQSVQQQNIFIRQHSNVPQELQFYQRQRKKQQMHIYKNDLDKLMEDKMSMSRKNNQGNSQTQTRIKYRDDYHNPLINPLPYNIQNPYILKEMQKITQNQSQMIRNDRNYEDQANGYYEQTRPRNQSSYFARQGGNLLLK